MGNFSTESNKKNLLLKKEIDSGLVKEDLKLMLKGFTYFKVQFFYP